MSRTKISKATIERLDSWVNARSGFGGLNSAQSVTSWQRRGRLSFSELENLYQQNWMARAIVNAEPEDATRRWLKLVSKGGAQNKTAAIEKLQRLFERLNVRNKFKHAHMNARLYGGAAIVIGAFDGQEVDMPLNTARVSDVMFMNVVDRWRCNPVRYYTDQNDTRYGKPSHYLVTELNLAGSRTMIVHESRLLIFDGEYLPDNLRNQNNGWGASSVEAAYEAIKDYGVASQSLGNVAQDFITKTLKVGNLRELIANGDWDVIQTRLQMAVQQMSSHNLTLIGEDEEMQKMATPVSGIDSLTSQATRDVTGASRIPESRMFSAQGGNLNSDGGASADLRNWYDTVKETQHTMYLPNINRLIDVLGAQLSITQDDVEVEFAPLWEPSETEQSEVYSRTAQADAVYVQWQVLSPEEIRKARFGSGKFTTGAVAIESDETPEPPASLSGNKPNKAGEQ